LTTQEKGDIMSYQETIEAIEANLEHFDKKSIKDENISLEKHSQWLSIWQNFMVDLAKMSELYP